GPPGPPPFLGNLFPPNLVMEHQEEIGLRPAQAEAIKKAMGATQERLLDVQWKLASASEALTKLLATDHGDEAAVPAKREEVAERGRKVKKEISLLLVRTKTQPAPEQQAKPRARRPARPPHGPEGPPPPPP